MKRSVNDILKSAKQTTFDDLFARKRARLVVHVFHVEFTGELFTGELWRSCFLYSFMSYG